jgi:hypothetical protein
MMAIGNVSPCVESTTKETWEANQSSVLSHTTQHIHREGAIAFGDRSKALPGPTQVPTETETNRDRYRPKRPARASWTARGLPSDITAWSCHAGALEDGMAREPERYQLQLIASGRVALIKSKLDLFGAHSLKWRLATSTVSRLPNA